MKRIRNLVLIPCLGLLCLVALTACSGGSKGYSPGPNRGHARQGVNVHRTTSTRGKPFVSRLGPAA
jgi:hypothetical protein